MRGPPTIRDRSVISPGVTGSSAGSANREIRLIIEEWGVMNIALWIAQALLALAFFGAGFTKLKDDRLTYARARPPMTSFAEDLSDRTFKTIGVLEVLGAIGLVLPRLLGIAPFFTPLAALGFVGLMTGAIVTHLRRGERQLIIINVVLMLLALFVFWGRGVEVLLGNDAS